MEAFFLSAFIIAISEIGDKTQLIALCLATRFGRPIPVILGIFAATLVSNLAAGALGQYIGIKLEGKLLHLILAASFLGAAIWALIPDKIDDCPEDDPTKGHSIFLMSLASFLIAEMGDKTQLATIALAARFHTVASVVAGTTLGMMAANIPVIFFGAKIMSFIPLGTLRIVSGTLFAILGVVELSRV